MFKLFKSAVAVIALAGVTLVGCDTVKQAANDVLLNKVSDEDVASALKEALNIGISAGADSLSQAGGYFNSPYKILLPAEAQKVTAKLKFIPGFSDVENQVIKKINAGAENAATKAKPIFLNAIRQMSFTDAVGILMGDQTAATQFLKNKTYDQLYTAFKPEITTSLNQYGALDYWGKAVNTYNKIPFIDQVNPSLDDYVAKQALTGLFSMVANKEVEIRANKGARVTDLLKKVFAKQDKK